MKIEKVNDHQIRCTLTKADLADRELKISELAYGTEKAKNLFRDMMQQASFEFGFEAEDIPLMIEAIPLNAESIVLIITKVEDPEELDTRFSKFAPSVHADSDVGDDLEEAIEQIQEQSTDVMDLYKKIKESPFSELLEAATGKNAETSNTKSSNKANASAPKESKSQESLLRIYSFVGLPEVIRVTKVIQPLFQGTSALYKHSLTGRYVLTINKADTPTESFVKICNILGEYGTSERGNNTVSAHLQEHYRIIRQDDAIDTLSRI